MSSQSAVTYLLLGFLAAQSLPAQTGDWAVVAARPSGTHIVVISTHHHRACTLIQVSDSELICEEEPRRFFRSGQLAIPRQEIREVREEHARATKKFLGAVVGLGVGAGIGAGLSVNSKDAETRVYGPITGALFGMIAGLVAGQIASQVHSRVIYQR